MRTGSDYRFVSVIPTTYIIVLPTDYFYNVHLNDLLDITVIAASR